MFEKIKSFLFKNTSQKQTVAKNTVWLSISNFGGRLIKAAVVIYGARVLGTSGWGVFSYAVTLAGFFTLFVDPGISAIFVREGAKATEKERVTLFSTTFALKLIFLAGSVLIVLFVAPYFSTLPGAIALLPVVAILILGDGLRDFFSSLMRIREEMQWDAATFLLENSVILVLGLIFLRIDPTPLAFAWAYAAGAIAGAVAAAAVIRQYFKNIISSFSRKLIRPLFQAAWPFAVMTGFGVLLTNTDILIISWMKTAADVGIYSATIRIVQLLYLVPLIVQYSTLPILSRLAKTDSAKFRVVLEKTIGIIFLIAVPVAAGGMVLATSILGFVFGPAYAAGGIAFSILLGSLLFDYAGSTVSNAVFAHDRQKSLIVASAIGGISNVIFDLIFIPRWGINGSAVATLIAQIASNWYLWHTMKKVSYFEPLAALKKVFLAGIMMGAITFAAQALGVNLIINIIFSGAIYVLLLMLFREPLFLELKNILGLSGDQSVLT